MFKRICEKIFLVCFVIILATSCGLVMFALEKGVNYVHLIW